jgi:hypothetical protein
MRVGGPWLLYSCDKHPTHFIGAGCAPVWTGAEGLVPIGIRSPDYPACGMSQYRLLYPGPHPCNEYRQVRQRAVNLAI